MNYEFSTKPSHSFVQNTSLALAVGGHGKVNFALSAFELSKALKPKLVVCVGASGGLANCSPLELIAATKTVEHDYKNGFGPKSSLPEFPGDKPALHRLSLSGVKTAIIASGDEDITSSKRALEIHNSTHASAVAWEGAGGAKACLKTQTPYLELRFISDMCNQNTETDFKENLEAGMSSIAKALLTLEV